jgi:urease beta subunit
VVAAGQVPLKVSTAGRRLEVVSGTPAEAQPGSAVDVELAGDGGAEALKFGLLADNRVRGM